jgi:hypothetical protein
VKTSNLVMVIMAVMLSTGGFMSIDYLFTHTHGWHERHSAAVMLRL